jgi:hypothetical protein
VASDPRRPLIGPPPPATLADSLQSLVGGGVNVKERPRLLGLLDYAYPGRKERDGLLGVAFPRSFVAVQDMNDRDTLMHEFGHIADFRKQHPDVAQEIKRLTPQGEKPAEHFADVYMSAVGFLQGQASRRPEVAQRVLAMLEQNLPGAERLVASLLRDPLYREHPLNQQGNEQNPEPRRRYAEK